MATATWNGGNGGTWSAGSSNWTTDAGAYAWENKETVAIFGPGGPTNSIAISGTVIAHGLTFNAGASGYALSGGAITVTGGGITANESVTINSNVTVGAPQIWNTAATKTLTLGGDVHTVISTLTVTGAGDTYIAGALDGGGVINSLGATAGSIAKKGTGTLTVAGASNYDGLITISGGALNLAPNSGLTATYNGRISGAGNVTKTGMGTVVLGAYNTYSGQTTISAGSLQVTGSLSRNGSTKVFIAKDANGILGDGNGDANITRRVAEFDTYAGLGSAITNLGSGELASKADILAGDASIQSDVSMAWRIRTVAEKSPSGGGLISEVLGLGGVALVGVGTHNGNHETDTFVLQMTYDPTQLQSIWGLTESQAVTQGQLSLGYLDFGPDGLRGTVDDRWMRAGDGNFGGTPNYVGDRPYDSTSFVLGDYGVDTINHVAWAVMNHNSEFAVVSVPEPSMFTLLGSGVLALLAYAWRRRRTA